MPQITNNVRMSSTVNHYYNVSQGVGWRRQNDRLDILLVQFFLNNIKSRNGMFIQPQLAQDGLWGSKTQAAIKKFQRSWNRVIATDKPRVAEDATVSPGQGVTYANGTKTWTILALNALVGNEPNFGPEVYVRLHTHPNCPRDLIGFFASAPAPVQPPGSRRTSLLRRRDRTIADLRRNERGEGLSRPPLVRPPRPFNRRDPGVMWAAYVLQPGRVLFTDYQYSEVMEHMEGLTDLEVESRTEFLRQAVELTIGDSWVPGMSVEGIREMLRQRAVLHMRHSRNRLVVI